VKIDKIKNIFEKCGIKKGQTIFIHGDAGAIAQLENKNKDKLKYFFNFLKRFIGNKGNIIVPTFTYESCKSKKFDYKTDKSETGLFSEIFRNLNYTKRTDHPIFSCAIYGKKFDYFNQSKITTCFGKDSIFERFMKINGTIICLGCSIDRITFTHYVEEFFKVKYRHNKNFRIFSSINKKSINTNYYVRKLNMKSKINLQKLYKYLVKKKRIKVSNFGRYKILSIKSKLFFQSCLELLKKDKYSLIQK
jgi:aminoglycoside 3-N-acetyltransferase